MENDMDTSVEQKVTRRFRLLIILSIISLLVSILSMVLVVRINSILTFDRNERGAREFVEKIVGSINQRTDFYKYHCRKDAIPDIEGYVSEFTNNYKITFIEFSSPIYSYDLTFDGKNKFRIDVVYRSSNNFEVDGFIPILKKNNR
jgi:hypothetical protein